MSITDLCHGDFGILNVSNSKDLIIYISNSGNTQELINCTKYVKSKIFDVLGYFKNVITVSNNSCNQYVYIYEKKNLTKFDTLPKHKITDCNNYLDELKQKYTKVFYYLSNTNESGNNSGEELSRFFTSAANNTSSTRNKSKTDIRAFIKAEVANLKFKYHRKILQVAQKLKMAFPNQIDAFLKSIKNTNDDNYTNKTYKHTYHILKFR